ncbi:PDZ domain-containing protein [Fictibacillus enclensis]|uniref:PDZ domain-containing protein n=1 Tax=Fictibacillus enclensis TaxID=1017270 RepID=A0A0V8J8J2_9BACL|nr:PDZ domain-containing protein [Fictibacillus enclensis]KSU83506.1 hypothetical protein AS030_13175 [Fictibacillus enclensis]SCC16591.1 PDZ domain-containing protein [Fictibacillus enclensis]
MAGSCLLEIDGSKVKSVANLGNSDAVKAGEQAIAIGNPLGYLAIETLEKQGKIKRPQMGIVPQSLNQIPTASRQHDLNLPDTVQNGAVVLNVKAGGPAEKAGLQNYDVITELDGKEIDTAASLREYIFKHQAGDHITVTYYRDGQKASAELTLEDVSK